MAKGLIQYVGENADNEAEQLEAQAADLERRAAECRKLAGVLRDLGAIAKPHIKPVVLELNQEAA